MEMNENRDPHGPPTPAEIRWNEDNYPVLAAHQDPDLCWQFEKVETVRAMNLPVGTLSDFAREFHCAAVWHCFRSRPALQEKYQRLSHTVQRVLSENLN
jgi:hypothetical protein